MGSIKKPTVLSDIGERDNRFDSKYVQWGNN
jgi:hypothetical protein